MIELNSIADELLSDDDTDEVVTELEKSQDRINEAKGRLEQIFENLESVEEITDQVDDSDPKVSPRVIGKTTKIITASVSEGLSAIATDALESVLGIDTKAISKPIEKIKDSVKEQRGKSSASNEQPKPSASNEQPKSQAVVQKVPTVSNNPTLTQGVADGVAEVSKDPLDEFGLDVNAVKKIAGKTKEVVKNTSVKPSKAANDSKVAPKAQGEVVPKVSNSPSAIKPTSSKIIDEIAVDVKEIKDVLVTTQKNTLRDVEARIESADRQRDTQEVNERRNELLEEQIELLNDLTQKEGGEGGSTGSIGSSIINKMKGGGVKSAIAAVLGGGATLLGGKMAGGIGGIAAKVASVGVKAAKVAPVAGVVGGIASKAGSVGAKVASVGAKAAPVGVKAAEVIGKSTIGAVGKKVAGKSLGILGKKIPGVGLAVGAGLAANRLSDGDPVGALMEVASGLAAIVPVFGTAASIAIDASIITRDLARENAEDAEGNQVQALASKTSDDPDNKLIVPNANLLEQTSKVEGNQVQTLASKTSVDSNGELIGPNANLLEQISKGEGTSDEMARKHGIESGFDVTLGFNRFGNKQTKPLTEMNVGEVKELQQSMLSDPSNKFNASPVGKFQIVNKTLRGLQKDMGFSDDQKFDEDFQLKLGNQLLKGRGIDKFKSGEVSMGEFNKELAKEWASVALEDGQSFHNQPVGSTSNQIRAAIIKDRENEMKTASEMKNSAPTQPQLAAAGQTTNIQANRQGATQLGGSGAANSPNMTRNPETSYQRLLTSGSKGSLS